MFAKQLKNKAFATVVAFLVIAILLPVVLPQKASAVTASDWKAGRIIDDAVFYNKNSMSAQQIQQFIEAKVPVCDRNRASSNPSYQPPWTCLKEYQENTLTKENNIGRFNANGTPYNVPGGKLAGQIIWDVAQEYGINPQVLIVMLQKEQGLITDNWPWRVQYQKAMGYACPDTAPCDAQYYGFYNQVSSAAWQLKKYIECANGCYDAASGKRYGPYNFKAGVTRYIQYSPNAACGGTQVYLENAATAALYNYTPYQPNAGALANMYGTADCGAYGNRNFWRYFNDWFGSTYGIEIRGSIRIKYDAINGASLLGIPLRAEQGDPSFWWQQFTNGYIVGNADIGYYVSKGSIRKKWAEYGYQNGQLGLPISDEVYDAMNDLYTQRYQWGEIKTHSRGVNKAVIKGSIYQAYLSFNGKYNIPIKDEQVDKNGFWWQQFTNGYIVGTANTGYFESTGTIRKKWAEAGYQSSQVGIPISNIEETSIGCYAQIYTNGTINGCVGTYDIVLN